MPNPIAAPVKPTGGAIVMGLAVGAVLAGACTKFLTLNMPFGEIHFYRRTPFFDAHCRLERAHQFFPGGYRWLLSCVR